MTSKILYKLILENSENYHLSPCCPAVVLVSVALAEEGQVSHKGYGGLAWWGPLLR